MNPAWAKFAIIAACTLSGARDQLNPNKGLWGLGDFNGADHHFNGTDRHHPPSEAVCSLPCATIGKHLLARHLLPPFGQGLLAWLLSALPTLVLRGSRQVQGIRACLWPLMQLWLHLILAYLAFPHNPVWAYAWALHAPASVLISWAPPRRSLALQSLQPWLSLLGVLCIAFYAWSTGAPAGLVRWRTGAHSQCGWAAHLVAITGVDLLTGIMGPLGTLVTGSLSCAL